MNLWEFIVELIHYASWPVLVFVITLLFRKDIVAVLQRLKKVGHGNKYAEFIPDEIQKVASEKLSDHMISTNDPEMDVWKKEVLKNLLTTELTRQERLIVILYYYEEMTLKEIASSLDMSESSVQKLHERLVRRLRNKMGKIGSSKEKIKKD